MTQKVERNAAEERLTVKQRFPTWVIVLSSAAPDTMQHCTALCFPAATIQLVLVAGHDLLNSHVHLAHGRSQERRQHCSLCLPVQWPPETTRRGSRLHKSAEWVKKIRDAKAAKEKKLQQARRRRALKQRQHEGALTVNRPDDTDEIRELRAALGRAQHVRNAAEAAVTRTSRSVAHPNMSKITIADIRNYLGLAHARHDQKWAELRRDVLRLMSAGVLDLSLSWKEHDNQRLARVYDMGAHPGLQSFRAASFLVQELFGEQKAHRARVLETRMTRLEYLEAMILDYESDDEDPLPRLPLFYKATGPRAPSSPNRNDTSATHWIEIPAALVGLIAGLGSRTSPLPDLTEFGEDQLNLKLLK
ncbi:hypothetical protein B0H13DRAFT_1927083 [Mycena leptocephala]|nr:hypothetical protein B0H13DRAFT_1927083 [Mycena leptocephala]